MSIPSGTTNFPLGHNFAITVGGRTFLLDSIDLPEKTTRVINRTNQDGDASDYQIRQAGEKITGSAVLQRLNTNTAPPKSGDTILWTTEDDANADYMLGYVTDVKVARSKDSADVFEIGFLAEDFLDINYGITTGDFVTVGSDSFTATGNTGFTMEVGTTSSYGALQFEESLPTYTSVYVSFNLTQVSGTSSPNVSLRNSSPNGTASMSNLASIGFNSFTLSTGSFTSEYISIADGSDGFNSEFTISDFQVSLSPLTSTKLVRLKNVGSLSNTEFFFSQGGVNGFAQTLDTTSGSGLIGIDSNYATIGKVKYDLGASAGTNKTIQLKVAYPTTKQISGTHDFTRFSNFSVLSTETVSGKKHSIIQGDANVTSRNTILIGLNLEDA
mgnify:CR=1 FL=1|tara:strand:- start:9880 stop:11034 length:1155 start_codon:yes stop_codon:yes gene_type:complete